MFCQKISKCILYDACLKTGIFTANVWLINNFNLPSSCSFIILKANWTWKILGSGFSSYLTGSFLPVSAYAKEAKCKH